MSGDGKFWVCYEVLEQKMAAGPYACLHDADSHKQDIAGFEGVRGAFITPILPAGYTVLK